MSGGLEYFGPENDGEDLVANLVENSVVNLVDIQTGSTVYWRLTFITTGDYAGSRVQQGDE